METSFKHKGEEITVKENIFDRAIRAFNPQKANDRFNAKVYGTYMASTGGYVGASKVRQALRTWNPLSNDADTELSYDLDTLRDRSFDLIKNAPLAGTAIETVSTHVVGSGLKVRPQIDEVVLNMSDDEAEEWEAIALREFDLFEKHCDSARQHTFGWLQELAFRNALAAGDIFAPLPMISRPESPYKTKIQLIEGARISNPNRQGDSAKLISGIKKDDDGNPLSCFIANQYPGNIYNIGAAEWKEYKFYGPNGRRNILHLFKATRIGQTRGEPYLSAVIEPLKQISRLTEAELMASVVQGMFTIFIKSENQSEDGNALGLPEAEGNDGSDDKSYEMGYGKVVEMSSGDSIESANPSRPNANFDPFFKAIVQQIGARLGVPCEMLLQQYTTSYVAARAAILQAWKFFKIRRQWLVDYFCQPVYEAFMDEAVSTGRINAPGYFEDPIIRQAYLGTVWIGPPQGMIKEKEEAEAAKIMVEEDFKTRDEVTAETTGGNFKRKLRKRVKEEEARRAGGRSETIPSSVSGVMPEDDNDDNDDDSNKGDK